MDGISQSFHSSLLVQSLQRKQPGQSERPTEDKIGRCCQLLLVSALCGIEMCLSFEQIYQILFLQFLDVPVQLVSLNGVVCGCTSMVILPILGILGDRGSDPKFRKMVILFVGMLMFLTGLTSMAISGVIKLTNHATNVSADPNSTWEAEYSDFTATLASIEINTTNTISNANFIIPNNSKSISLPVTAFLAITSFALMDIGFDVSVSLTRAYVLGMVPSVQHTSLLMTATVAQALAGTAFSSVGCFDFPSILGSVFNVEGVAATLIFFCVLLFVIIVLGYTSTILTGVFINSRRNKSYVPLHQDNSPIKQKSLKSRKSLKARRKLEFKDNRQSYKPDILHTEERCTETKPLILEESYHAISASLAKSGSGSVSGDRQRSNPVRTSYATVTQSSQKLKPGQSTAAHTQSRLSRTGEQRKLSSENREDFSISKDIMQVMDSSGDSESEPSKSFSQSVLAALRQSLSLSTTTNPSPLGEFHNRKLAQLQTNSKNSDQKIAGKRSLFSRHLLIFCLSSFFSMGASLCIVVYASNALTISIYGGDPTAHEGTEGYQRYNQGLRVAALGNLTMYVSFLITSVSNHTILNILGEMVYFVVSHCLFIISLLTLLLTQSVEVYFVFMIFYGIFRSTVFTLTYVLANKIYLEQRDSVDSGEDIGKLMSMIGFLIPSHYMLISSFMGPLIDMTDNTWTPLMYSLASGSLGLIIFSTLFCLQKQQAPVSAAQSK